MTLIPCRPAPGVSRDKIRSEAFRIGAFFLFFSVVTAAGTAVGFAASQQDAYEYTAVTAEPARQQGTVNANNVIWHCRGTRCTASAPWPKPSVSTCSALAKVVGRIRTYGRPGYALSASEISQCTAVIAGTASAPGVASSAIKPVAPATGTKPASQTQTGGTAPSSGQGSERQSSSQPPQSSRPAQGSATPPSAATFSPRSIRTAALRVTGTGATATIGAGFTPVTIRTARLAITGTGATAAIGAGFVPRTLRTAPLSVTGTGSL